jgi:hypothetical protein
MNPNESKEGRPASGHSSYVDLALLLDGKSYSLAQIGPDFVRLREPIELTPCEAEVVMKIDGVERRRWNVFLKYGAVPFDLNVATADT